MFGYIVPLTGELKVRELELYRAYYCGLCGALKSEYKKTAVLNFDSVFLYLLADGLRVDEGEVMPAKCALHPVSKRPAIITPAALYAADVNILMAYYSALDHARDKKRGGALAAFFLKKAFAKAKERRENIVFTAEATIGELVALERERTKSTDAVADSYARLFAEALTDADVLQSHILHDLGYSLGRWVYLIDAAEDIEQDQKSGNYNVYLEKYGGANEKAKEEIAQSLYYTLSQAAEALGRLALHRNKELLENIIYLGCREQTRSILETGRRLTAPVEKKI